MRKFKTGLVIGRFQPFHKGHEYLIAQALKYCEAIIIGIGSANKKSKKNPWPSSLRRKMLKEFIEEKGYSSKVKKIVNLYDNPDDDIWFSNLIKKTGPIDVTIGNNPWNNGIIEGHGIRAVEVGFLKREKYEGIQIRSLMKEKKPWEERVPKYLVKHLK